jgi:O-Antigen ligase
LIAGNPPTPALSVEPRFPPYLVPPSNTAFSALKPAEHVDVLQTLTFYMGLAVVFLMFSMLHQIQSYVMHFKAYLLYIFGVPAMFGILVAGGVRRALTVKGVRTAYYWIGFGLWIFVIIPFSTWHGGSFRTGMSYAKTGLLIFFAIAGLAVSWRQCRLIVQCIGVAAIVNLLSARMFSSANEEGRLQLDLGSVANANDFAAHLFLTLPFLLLAAYAAKSVVLRGGALLGVAIGILVIFRTGSRGALLALTVDLLFVFFRGGMLQRIVVACFVPLTLVGVLLLVPDKLMQRIHSFSSSAAVSDVAAEAAESTAARAYLLKKGIEYTLQYPLVGVGPGQFGTYEGEHNMVVSGHGMWHGTHNSWVQASAECGIPGGLLLLGGWVSSFLLLNRTYRMAKKRPDCLDIQQVTFCVMLAILGFCVAITFLNFAYFFYGPAMGGLAIAIWRAANQEFDRRTPLAVRPA